MITEDYISFEIAKLLKEKGFDVSCKVWYAEYTSLWGGDSSGDRKYINIQFDDENRFDESYKFLCYAPTLQMAMKWLLREYKLYVNICPSVKGYYWTEKWHSYVEDLNKRYPFGRFIGTFDFPEEAVEAAIKYCLEHLI